MVMAIKKPKKIKKKVKEPKVPKEPKEPRGIPKGPKVVIKIEKERENVWLTPLQKSILSTVVAKVGLPLAMYYLSSLYNQNKDYFEEKKSKTKGKFENFFTNFFINNDEYKIKNLQTKEQVKKRCNELYLEYHPDRQGGDSKKFIEIRKICEKKLKEFN